MTTEYPDIFENPVPVKIYPFKEPTLPHDLLKLPKFDPPNKKVEEVERRYYDGMTEYFDMFSAYDNRNEKKCNRGTTICETIFIIELLSMPMEQLEKYIIIIPIGSIIYNTDTKTINIYTSSAAYVGGSGVGWCSTLLDVSIV